MLNKAKNKTIVFDNKVFQVTETTGGLIEVHMDIGSLMLDGTTYRVLDSEGVVLKESEKEMTVYVALRWATDVINHGV